MINQSVLDLLVIEKALKVFVDFGMANDLFSKELRDAVVAVTTKKHLGEITAETLYSKIVNYSDRYVNEQFLALLGKIYDLPELKAEIEELHRLDVCDDE